MRTKRKNKNYAIRGADKAPLFYKEVGMKAYKSDKKIKTDVMVSWVIYLLTIVVLMPFFVRLLVTGNMDIMRMCIYIIGFGVLAFLGIRFILMYQAVRGAYLIIDGDEVSGTYNNSPKTKLNKTFKIKRSEILSVSSANVPLSMRAGFKELVINVTGASYHCFGVSQTHIKEIIEELQPKTEDDNSKFY